MAADPRFLTNALRVEHRDAVVPLIGGALRQRCRDELLRELDASGVPAGPINTLADVFGDPQVIHRALRLDMDAPWVAGGRVPGVRTPISFSDAQLAIPRAAPRLGEHTQEVQEAPAPSVSVAPEVAWAADFRQIPDRFLMPPPAGAASTQSWPGAAADVLRAVGGVAEDANRYLKYRSVSVKPNTVEAGDRRAMRLIFDKPRPSRSRDG